ncbi:IclR family transcriptional regulator [Hydrogenophaga electricum]|uniref:IclR family transcriptional regulator n=1 Tax=Hydrogenophaga electricum TaxID=1230953 RepID=A0ABQ6C6T7_9BURK|nr:IclR family transcriptional regulator [Hydrogenophaga electricum]GLS15514.1 IclR family transcriptional regulator [Hydrogenophaga electricum]
MNDKNTASADDRYTVPALQRGLQLLMQFSREDRELTGAELSRRLDLPRASVFRMLFTLEQGGFVERVGDGNSYKLGLAVLRLGFEYLASMELTEHGRPVIEELRDRCGYSAHLVVRDGRDVVFIAKAAGHNAMFHSIQVGARLPAHATVLGRLLLGNLDLAALRHLYPESPLPAYTTRTPTTLEQLKILIDLHRLDGYGVSQGGFETGISTIGAPVFNDRGEVAAAVSIAVPAQHVNETELPQLIEQVKGAAAQLTDRISHLPNRGAWQPNPPARKAA